MSERPSPLDPGQASTQELRAATEAAFDAGDLDAAIELAKVLSGRDNLDVWSKALLGRLAIRQNDPASALTWLEAAHAELPNEGSILVFLSEAFAAAKKWKNAADRIAEAIALRPTIASLYERYGIYLRNAGQVTQAEEAWKKALVLDPGHSSILTLLGELRLSQDLEAEAKPLFQKALQSDETNASALSNLALAYEREGDLSKALNTVDSLIKLNPSHANVHRRGQLLLSMGRLEEGWSAYARRLKSPDYESWQFALGVPYWAGEDITDKHVLIWTDQGLGEQILTVSLLNDVIALAKTVTLACDPRLIPLFQRSWPDVTVVSLTALRDEKKAMAAVDVQATLSELGAALRRNLEAFPQPNPFLKAKPERTAALREQLKSGSSKPLIGLSWRSANPLAGEHKSTDLLEHWAPILSQSRFTFVALQYGDVADELEAVRKALEVTISTIPDMNFEQDVDGFAAAVAAMDGVVSISNTTVHVAGGLGVPVQALMPAAYGRPWYWFESGDTTPWYDGVVLYRSKGDWGDTVTGVAKSLSYWTDT